MKKIYLIMTLVALMMVSCEPDVKTPDVITKVVSEINLTSAQSGGEILGVENSDVIARGVCWNTEQNPMVTDNHTVDGKGIGSFTSSLENLNHNTTYYVRAYATTDDGITYGNEVSFTTLDPDYEYNETGKINGYAYVDLGLSVKWSTCNIGANSPEEYGLYFAWGETSPKTEYTEENSLTYKKQMEDISGDEQYDAAVANWGGGWRLATEAEFSELINNCIWIMGEENGINGFKVIGPNGNSIFIPTSGCYYGTSFSDVATSIWSSTPCDECNENVDAKSLCIFTDYIYVYNHSERCIGATIRPVVE